MISELIVESSNNYYEFIVGVDGVKEINSHGNWGHGGSSYSIHYDDKIKSISGAFQFIEVEYIKKEKHI